MTLGDRVVRGARKPALVIPMVLVFAFAMLVPLAGAALGAAKLGPGTRTLQVTPETDDNPIGATHSVTATLRNAANSADEPADVTSGSLEIDFEITGPNDPDAGDTPATPDFTCTVAEASATCSTTSYPGPIAGADTIRGWIDADKNNVTVEADLTEGQDEATTPGAQTEPDTTDVSTKTWFAGLPAGAVLDCDDEQATAGGADNDNSTNPITGEGTDETYTCTLVDTGTVPATPIAGAKIDAENLGGANDPDNSAVAGTADMNDACTTGADGTCTVVIAPVESQLGTADICFWVDGDVDANFDDTGAPSDGGQCGEAFGVDDSDTTDVVRKSWEERVISYIDVTPDLDVNQTGTSHTSTATVYDQFDAPVSGVNVDWFVNFFGPGRNTVASTLNTVTNANGEVTMTYSDTGTLGTAGEDEITACTDQNPSFPHDDCFLDPGEVRDTATKRWIPEPAVASAVAIDLVGCNGNTADFTAANWNLTDSDPVDSTQEVCASAKTAGGEVLYGHTVTFTTTGPGMLVDAAGNDLGPTVDVVIADDGYAHQDIYSTVSGDQVITATIDTHSAAATETWEPLTERNIDLEPETATNPPGTIHTVTATVTDRFGNGVPGVNVAFTETGAGAFRNGSTALTVVTDAAGVAIAETTTLTTETGDQTITGALPVTPGPANDECEKLAGNPTGSTAGNCTDDVVKTWAAAPFCPGFEGDTRNQIVGTDGDDVLAGTADQDIICGLGGADELRGSMGRDVIKGGSGNDFMAGGGDNDKLLGGGGPDTAKGNAGQDTCKSAATKQSCELP